MTKRTIADASTLGGWHKSSYSGNNSGTCVEVIHGYAAGVPVRDSVNPAGPALVVPRSAWAAFIAAVKSGDVG